MRRRLQCQEMVELVTAYLEDALDFDTRTRFEKHLRRCDGCSDYLEQLRITVQTVGTLDDDELDPVFRARLLKAFAETAGSW
nr:zf-HC2 domain-containing protein [Mycolicibacterium hodleri]